MTAEKLSPIGPLLSVKNLGVHYRVRSRNPFAFRKEILHAVDHVSFDILPGETVAIVGESGCGKSSLGRALVRLAPISTGKVCFEGTDIATIRGGVLKSYRRNVQMIFQDPFASLNPYMKAWQIVTEPLVNFGFGGTDLRSRAGSLLEAVGLGAAHLDKFPHQFSGGQRQRLGIARALSVDPKLIVCDEAIAALDVSVQAQVINLLGDIQRERGIAYLFISHDLGVVAHIAQRTAVMYLGEIVEQGDTKALFRAPAHPYTKALIASVPDVAGRQRQAPLLGGTVPSPLNPPRGCRFHTRCPKAQPVCASRAPLPSGASRAACHFPES